MHTTHCAVYIAHYTTCPTFILVYLKHTNDLISQKKKKLLCLFFLSIFRPSLTSCAAPAVSRTFLPKLGNSLKFISSSHSVARTPLQMSRQKVVRLPGFIDTGGVRHPYFGLLPFCLMYPVPRGVPWSDTISFNQPSWFHCFRKLPSISF